MRDMTTQDQSFVVPRLSPRRKWYRLRPWVQTMFAVVWLMPMARLGQVWATWFPSCVFHCYSCPLASLACPIGIVANFSSWHIFPFLAVGVLVTAGALLGSIICGWACPFGLLQDLAGRVPIPRLKIPNWMSYGRYVVLVGMVVVAPWFLGPQDKPAGLGVAAVAPAAATPNTPAVAPKPSGGKGFHILDDESEKQFESVKPVAPASPKPVVAAPQAGTAVAAVRKPFVTKDDLFICRSCPAGAAEGGIPYVVQNAANGRYKSWTDIFDTEKLGISPYKWTILGVFVVAIFVTFRPWCKVLCPLGGFLSLFNHLSVFHLRYQRNACNECNTCRSRCTMGVNVDKNVNTHICIRCMECTTCGAITPDFGSEDEKG